MAWITLKSGKHVNTDWFNEDEQKRQQMQKNQEQAKRAGNGMVLSTSGSLTNPFNLPQTGNGNNFEGYKSRESLSNRKLPENFKRKPDERTKQAVKKLKAYGQPIRPIGGKTIRHQDWKPLENDKTPWGTETNQKTVAGNTWEDNQPQKALQAKVYDRTHNVMEKDYHKVDKAEVMKDIEGWKNDDGTYGTGDEAIYVAYEDGKVIALHELDPGEKWSKQGICGLSVSTGDYEMVWGGEYVRPKYGNPRFEPFETSEFDDNGNDLPGRQNSYSGYKVVGHYKERVLEQDNMKVQTNKTGRHKYNWDNNETRYQENTTTEVLQRSTIDWTDAKKAEVAAKLEADKVTDRTVAMLKKRGAVHKEEVEKYVRNLSDIRRNDLAKKMNIGGRGEEKTQEIIQTLKDRFDKVSVEQPVKKTPAKKAAQPKQETKPAKSNEPVIENEFGFEITNPDVKSPEVTFTEKYWKEMAELRKQLKFQDGELRSAVRNKAYELTEEDEYGDTWGALAKKFGEDTAMLFEQIDYGTVTDDEYWAGWHLLAEWMGLKKPKYTRSPELKEWSTAEQNRTKEVSDWLHNKLWAGGDFQSVYEENPLEDVAEYEFKGNKYKDSVITVSKNNLIYASNWDEDDRHVKQGKAVTGSTFYTIGDDGEIIDENVLGYKTLADAKHAAELYLDWKKWADKH